MYGGLARRVCMLSTIHYSITTTTVYFHHNHGRFCHICICSFCDWGRNFLIQSVFTVTNRKFPRKADSSCRASLKKRQIWNNFGPLKTTYPKIISQIYVLKKIFNYSKDGLKRVWSTYVASWGILTRTLPWWNQFGVNIALVLKWPHLSNEETK